MKSWLFPPRARGRKAWSQPPFWASDAMRSPYLATSSIRPDQERIENDFQAYVQDAYKSNGIVFACVRARQWILSGARFAWRDALGVELGRPYWSDELRLLEKPWIGGTGGDLIARAEGVAQLAGNYYATTADDNGKLGRAATGPGRRIVHMRPDWTTIVIGSPTDDPWDLRAKVVGYLYEARPSGLGRSEPVKLLADEVCHYAPQPDPDARFRGMSWLTPVLREIEADKAATAHKANNFKLGSRLSTVVTFDKEMAPEAFDEFVEKYRDQHEGPENAYRTLFLLGGTDVTTVQSNLKDLDFKAVQAAGEVRIASAAGVHPVILGISEGLSGSALNAGNFTAARRLFTDGTCEALWRMLAGSFQTLVKPPKASAELMCDSRGVAMTREDQKDAAEIQHVAAQTITLYVREGYTPESAQLAYEANDRSLLVHTGLTSVQLQAPGQGPETPPPADQAQP